MKINQPEGAPRGSFGIPPQMQEAMEKSRAQREAPPEREEPPAQSEEAQAAKAAVVEDNKNFVEELNPTKILESLGIKMEDKDFDTLLFKGFLEKEVIVVPEKVRPTLKTLTSEEYDLVDELLATDLKEKNMTNEGANIRRSMWTLAFGVTKMNGAPLCKPILNELKEVDQKAMAIERKKILGKFATPVVDLFIRKHGALSTALRLIIETPGDFLKNS